MKGKCLPFCAIAPALRYVYTNDNRKKKNTVKGGGPGNEVNDAPNETKKQRLYFLHPLNMATPTKGQPVFSWTWVCCC